MIYRVLCILLIVSACSVCTAVSAEQKPSLIPLPQSLEWTGERFPLEKCSVVIISDTVLEREADKLAAITGRDIPVRFETKKSDRYVIRLSLGAVSSPFGEEEAYRLVVRGDEVALTANTPHGIFNGLQTLGQLIGRDELIPGCVITDYPAYSWRGYMVDVGRNYQSLEQIKEQIDVMARYKLNVFHFHLTENVAWRLQIKQYPELTAAESMERNKGEYYSIEQMKELITYCRDRYITLVPEIDMPGHSAAFTRAMGVDMQSDSGLAIVKNILREVCTTYDIPYIHIGADEVDVRNKRFLPEVTELIRRHNKTVIAWSPGGNYDDHTVRQLWKDEGEGDIGGPRVKYIDSRFLYLSDMDPESSVVTIFQRQLGEKKHGDEALLGAEICLWDDRRMEQEEDHLTMNALYPDMLAFGERSWRGGGYPGVAYYIGPDSSARAQAFAAFEKRLLAHKQDYFSQLPFPYVKQTHISWKLFGPFENKGELGRSYWPEKPGSSLVDSAAAIVATGGTVWLWHTHGPPVKAWLPAPKENTTWYAFTRFRSGADTVMEMWIEFKNLSRSGADATPPAGQWDYKKSRIWINDQPISPPDWKHPGMESGKLEEPLTDEGYYYRPPERVAVRKGWNSILVKLPLHTFDPLKDWQVPPKWMFTVIPVRKGKGVNRDAAELLFNPGPVNAKKRTSGQ